METIFRLTTKEKHRFRNDPKFILSYNMRMTQISAACYFK